MERGRRESVVKGECGEGESGRWREVEGRV